MKRLFVSIILVVFVLIFVIGCTPQDEDKQHYSIDIKLEDKTLHIKEDIHFVNVYDVPLDVIRLRSCVGAFSEKGDVADKSDMAAYPFGVNYADVNISSIKVGGKAVPYTFIDSMYIDVHLKKPLKVGKGVDISIEMTETIPKNRLRYGYTDASINLGNAFIRVAPMENGEWTQYPYALNGDPFYDDIADFDVRFECDSAYNVVTTGKRSVREHGNNNVYTISCDNVRDFAMMLSDKMHIIKDNFDGIDIEYMSLDSAASVRIGVVKNVLDIFNRIYGRYPYDNIAIVENDFLEGGMEYPMLVYVNRFLASSTIEKVIIHELAHEWWYAVVGDNENKHYIIDEGLAELSVYLYYMENGEIDYAHALMKMMEDDYLMYRNSGNGIEKMDIELDKLSDIDYYSMAYLKAPLMFYKIMNQIGKDAFLDTLKMIFDKYKYRNITLDEFLDEFGTLGDEMREYIDGKPLC